MNNGRAWGISRSLRDKQLRCTREVRRINRARFWARVGDVASSYQTVTLVAAAGAVLALWVGWFR